MKAQTKLAIRRLLLRGLRALLWRADEWLHAKEQKMRAESDRLSVSIRLGSPRTAEQKRPAVPHGGACNRNEFLRGGISRRHARGSQPQRPAAPETPITWAQIKAENFRRRAAHQRPAWMDA